MIVQVLWDGLTSNDAVNWEHRVTHAAVHAWYEGHIEGETSRRGSPKMTLQEPEEEMPAPPFPARDSRTLATIVKNCTKQYEQMPHVGLMHAVADAWEAGYREGLECSGCHFRGSGDPRIANLMRNGGLRVEVKATAAVQALEAKLQHRTGDAEDAEDAARQALVNFFAADLRWQEKHCRKDQVPGAVATLDMLAVAIDVFGQLNCSAMAGDSATSDKDVAEILMEGVVQVAQQTLVERIDELRQLGREVAADED